MDYTKLRQIPLLSVLRYLGISTEFKVRKNGTEWYGRCPLHEAQKNQTSFSFSQSVYHCFSCGAKGSGAIDFTMAYKKMNFTEATELLSQFTGEVQPVPESTPQPNKVFKGSYEKFYVPCPWLQTRIPFPEVIKRYGVGLYRNPARKSAYTDKLMFPIRRFPDGSKTGYLARNISDEEQPKYIFPKGFHKSNELYGAYELSLGQALPLRIIYLVESPLCVLKYAGYGLPAVSSFGWSVSSSQVSILLQVTKGVVYLPDKDKRADATTYAALLSQSLWTLFPDYPSLDPESLSKEEILNLTKTAQAAHK